jgi:hypothetical protein
MKMPFAFVKWTKLEDTENGYRIRLNSADNTGFFFDGHGQLAHHYPAGFQDKPWQ